MALQKVFKKGYMDYLKNNIKIADYMQDIFPVDESQVVRLYGVTQPLDLSSRVVPTREGDITTAIAIYEAYSGLAPLMAQQDDLWVYLSHTDLFSYLKNRWPIVVGNGATQESVRNFITAHWFRNPNGIIRCALMGLWWAVYCSVDESREDKYELTRILFLNYSFRNNYYGASLLFRHREATLGILGFLKDNPEVFAENSETRGEFLTKYFNQLGGAKQLASLDRSFFRAECERIKPKLLVVTERGHVQNVDVYSAANN